MNIDLLRSRAGTFGLVCDAELPSQPKAALFDPSTGLLSLEFGHDDESLMCNVPVVEDWRLDLSMEDTILLGSVTNGVVTSAERLPIRSLL